VGACSSGVCRTTQAVASCKKNSYAQTKSLPKLLLLLLLLLFLKYVSLTHLDNKFEKKEDGRAEIESTNRESKPLCSRTPDIQWMHDPHHLLPILFLQKH
jgi:hypothetical protein